MMEKFSFPAHIFAAAIERDLVLFDTAADRYVALPGAVGDLADGAAVAGHRDLVLMPEAVAVLIGADMLVAGFVGSPALRPPPRPSRRLAIDEHPPMRAKLKDIASLATAVVRTNQRLKRGLPCERFTRTRQHQAIVSTSDLQSAMGRLREARLLVPHPRRCLPVSIVAALFLRGLRQEVEIVFGVRAHPFEAHCWIEADGIVLDDDLDRVRSFTPIAVGQL